MYRMLTFSSDYLQETFFMIGNHTFLKPLVPVKFPLVHFTKNPLKIVCSDILVISTDIGTLREHLLFKRSNRLTVYTDHPLSMLKRVFLAKVEKGTIILYFGRRMIIISSRDIMKCPGLLVALKYKRNYNVPGRNTRYA